MAGSQSRRREDSLSLDRIRQLAELMQEFGLSQLDVSEKGQRVRLCRGNVVSTIPGLMSPNAAGSAIAVPAPVPAENGAREDAANDEENIVTITSPMVGTFYNKANPDAEPYVQVGDHVGPDTIVCIIEAMKVFNEIPAEVSGRVVAALLENEEPVDFGKPLFKIDTSG